MWFHSFSFIQIFVSFASLSLSLSLVWLFVVLLSIDIITFNYDLFTCYIAKRN